MDSEAVAGTVIADGVIEDEQGRIHIHNPLIDRDIAAIAAATGASEATVREMYRAALADLSRHADWRWSNHPTQQLNAIQERIKESTKRRLHAARGDEDE